MLPIKENFIKIPNPSFLKVLSVLTSYSGQWYGDFGLRYKINVILSCKYYYTAAYYSERSEIQLNGWNLRNKQFPCVTTASTDSPSTDPLSCIMS
jgi:hypothetical protein